MTGKSPHRTHRDLFQPLLVDFIDGKHELALLAKKIDWAHFDKSFASFYSNTGQPALPIRFIVGCLLLKRIYNIGDETLARAWVMNPYIQYFCRQAHFHHRFLFHPSDFVHFRKRIGEEGVSMIVKHSVNIHGNQDTGKMEISDTSVQENNITFPTDAKLAKKIIDKCNGIAKKLEVAQRQTYRRTSKQLVRDTYNAKHPKRRKKAQKAMRKLKTLAGRHLRELRVKLGIGLDK